MIEREQSITAAYGWIALGMYGALLGAVAATVPLVREEAMDAAAWGRTLGWGVAGIFALVAAMLAASAGGDLRRIAVVAARNTRVAVVLGAALGLATFLGGLLGYQAACPVVEMLGWDGGVCWAGAWIGGMIAGNVAAAAMARRAR